MAETFAFQAEVQQLLNILVHSLYTEREIFLRELISNASDALHRLQFEQLTNRDVFDADAPLRIDIKTDKDAGTLTISDSGIGMTRDDMVQNLGVIAHSGAKAFMEAMQGAKNGATAQDVIGQFGVGFYSVFMVADKVRVVSRAHLPDAEAAAWQSDGGQSYRLEPAQRARRGTDIIIHLNDEAKEFLQAWRLKDIIRRHSDYVAFPIYVDDDGEPANRRTALWRQSSGDVSDEEYNDFYKMLTLDFEAPAHRIHMRADVPLQFYALLFIPASAGDNMLSLRREPGLRLYARKVLIQEHAKDLLPEYLQFVQGVVDSEDLPLNVSRESVQANRVMANLKKTLTNKVLGELNRMARKRREDYLKIFREFGRFIKQGLTVSPQERGEIEGLLFFNTTRSVSPDDLYSLSDYVENMARNQDEIYCLIGDDFASVSRSPHLDAFRQRGIDVLYFTDPVDPLMLMGLPEYQGHRLRNVDDADIDLRDVGEARADEPPRREPLSADDFSALRRRVAELLGDRVREVRESKSLTDSPARLVGDSSDPQRNLFRINRLLDQDYELPVKTLELNPRHPLIHNLSSTLQAAPENPLVPLIIEQLFETALLQEGIHPDPAAMAPRLHALMQAATGTPATELDYLPVAAMPGSEAAGETAPETAAAQADDSGDSA